MSLKLWQEGGREGGGYRKSMGKDEAPRNSIHSWGPLSLGLEHKSKVGRESWRGRKSQETKDHVSPFEGEILSSEWWEASETYKPGSLRFLLKVDMASRRLGWEAS